MMTPHKKHSLELDREGHKFVFLFDKSNWKELLRHVGRLAADPELTFNWQDAAWVGLQVRYVAFYHGWNYEYGSLSSA
jgi:hypothetical protein